MSRSETLYIEFALRTCAVSRSCQRECNPIEHLLQTYLRLRSLLRQTEPLLCHMILNYIDISDFPQAYLSNLVALDAKLSSQCFILHFTRQKNFGDIKINFNRFSFLFTFVDFILLLKSFALLANWK